MKLTDPEKLMLIMLTEIHEHLKITNGVDAKFVQSAIYRDNTWGLSWKFPGIFQGGGAPDPPTVGEVVDILDMWSAIETSYQRLSAEDQERIKVEAHPYGDGRFDGFDGNNETEHLGIARFLIDDLGRFTNFKGRELNSHLPLSLEGYRRMLAVFLPLRPSLGPDDLTAGQIIQLLRERLHPSRRVD